MKRERDCHRAALSTARSVVMWITLIVVAVSSAVLLSEVLLRLVYREEEVDGSYWGRGAFEHDEVTGFRHAAGFNGYVARRGAFVTPIVISQDNLRQTNVRSQMQHPKRVLILGDSFAFGLGVSEAAGFASLIQAPLNADGVGVINGAQSGYGVEQEAAFGMSLARTVQPDVIVLFLYLGNDVRADHQRRHAEVDVEFGYRLPKGRRLPIRPLDFLRTHSYLWMFLADQIEAIEGTGARRTADFNRLAEADPQAAIGATMKAIVELSEYCDNSDIALGVAIIRVRDGATPFETALREAIRGEGIPVLDLAEIELTDGDYFERDSHWNERGHEKVARSVAPFAMRLLEIGRPPESREWRTGKLGQTGMSG